MVMCNEKKLDLSNNMSLAIFPTMMVACYCCCSCLVQTAYKNKPIKRRAANGYLVAREKWWSLCSMRLCVSGCCVFFSTRSFFFFIGQLANAKSCCCGSCIRLCRINRYRRRLPLFVWLLLLLFMQRDEDKLLFGCKVLLYDKTFYRKCIAE